MEDYPISLKWSQNCYLFILNNVSLCVYLTVTDDLNWQMANLCIYLLPFKRYT